MPPKFTARIRAPASGKAPPTIVRDDDDDLSPPQARAPPSRTIPSRPVPPSRQRAPSASSHVSDTAELEKDLDEDIARAANADDDKDDGSGTDYDWKEDEEDEEEDDEEDDDEPAVPFPIRATHPAGLQAKLGAKPAPAPLAKPVLPKPAPAPARVTLKPGPAPVTKPVLSKPAPVAKTAPAPKAGPAQVAKETGKFAIRGGAKTLTEDAGVKVQELIFRKPGQPNRKSSADEHDLYMIAGSFFTIDGLHALFDEANRRLGSQVYPLHKKMGATQIRKPAVLARALADPYIREILLETIFEKDLVATKPRMQNASRDLADYYIQFHENGARFPGDSGDLSAEANIIIKGPKEAVKPQYHPNAAEMPKGQAQRMPARVATPPRAPVLPQGATVEMVDLLAQSCLDEFGKVSRTRQEIIRSILKSFGSLDDEALRKESIFYAESIAKALADSSEAEADVREQTEVKESEVKDDETSSEPMEVDSREEVVEEEEEELIIDEEEEELIIDEEEEELEEGEDEE